MAETDESAAASLAEDETDESVTELLDQLAREVSVLAFHETRLAATRHKPELRRAGRDVAAALAVALAFLTGFALANVAALSALSTTLADWLAALLLAAAWTAAGALLAFFLWTRARRVTEQKVEDVEAARADAEQAVRETLERLVPAIFREIALAVVPVASGIASDVVDAGEDIIEGADDMVEAMLEDVPGGGVVNQMWDVVLLPGRLGVRVATAFIKLGDSGSRRDE